MITRVLGQQLCFTRYLMEKDHLTACFTRMGSGFTPNSVLVEARHHLQNINGLMRQMEDLSLKPKDFVVAKDYQQLMQKSCCGRGD